MQGLYQKEVQEMIPILIDAADKEILPRWGKVVEEVKGTSASGYKDTVTEADKGASKRILEQVRKQFSGSYSEEDPYTDDPDRWAREFVWHFDPVDGTLEFCHKMKEGYALNAALLRRRLDGTHWPVAGIIYRPGDKTLVYNDGSDVNHFFRDGKRVDLPRPSRDAVRGWIRKVDPSQRLADWYDNLGRKLGVPSQAVPLGGIGASIVDLLEGKINIIMYNFNLTREWDWAMAEPMIKAARGFMCDLEGNKPASYNRKSTPNRDQYDLNGMVASTAFRMEEILPNIPRDLLEDRLPKR